jgi:hypothetical protein
LNFSTMYLALTTRMFRPLISGFIDVGFIHH